MSPKSLVFPNIPKTVNNLGERNSNQSCRVESLEPCEQSLSQSHQNQNPSRTEREEAFGVPYSFPYKVLAFPKFKFRIEKTWARPRSIKQTINIKIHHELTGKKHFVGEISVSCTKSPYFPRNSKFHSEWTNYEDKSTKSIIIKLHQELKHLQLVSVLTTKKSLVSP